MHAVTGCFHLTVTKDSNLSIILSKNYFNTALSVVIFCIDSEAVKINTNVNTIKKDHACKIDICSKTNVKSCVKNLLKISLVVNVNRLGNLLLVLVITLGTRSYEVKFLANCLVVRSAVRVTCCINGYGASAKLVATYRTVNYVVVRTVSCTCGSLFIFLNYLTLGVTECRNFLLCNLVVAS